MSIERSGLVSHRKHFDGIATDGEVVYDENPDSAHWESFMMPLLPLVPPEKRAVVQSVVQWAIPVDELDRERLKELIKEANDIIHVQRKKNPMFTEDLYGRGNGPNASRSKLGRPNTRAA